MGGSWVCCRPEEVCWSGDEGGPPVEVVPGLCLQSDAPGDGTLSRVPERSRILFLVLPKNLQMSSASWGSIAAAFSSIGDKDGDLERICKTGVPQVGMGCCHDQATWPHGWE